MESNKLEQYVGLDAVIEGTFCIAEVVDVMFISYNYKMYCKVVKVNKSVFGVKSIEVRPLYMYTGQIDSFPPTSKEGYVVLFPNNIDNIYEYLTPTTFWDHILEDK